MSGSKCPIVSCRYLFSICRRDHASRGRMFPFFFFLFFFLISCFYFSSPTFFYVLQHGKYSADRPPYADTPRRLRSESAAKGYHVDDMSALKPPYTGLECLHPLHLYNNSVNRAYDLVSDCALLMMSEAGLAKNSSAVLEEILMNIINHINGEQFIFLVFDWQSCVCCNRALFFNIFS